MTIWCLEVGKSKREVHLERLLAYFVPKLQLLLLLCGRFYLSKFAIFRQNTQRSAVRDAIYLWGGSELTLWVSREMVSRFSLTLSLSLWLESESDHLACWRANKASSESGLPQARLHLSSCRPTEVAQSWKVRERFKRTVVEVEVATTTTTASRWAACQMMDGKWWIAFYAAAAVENGEFSLSFWLRPERSFVYCIYFSSASF